jgi:hypothetical protein
MQYIKAHIFQTETEAFEAIETINQGEGIPVSEDAVTRTYTTAQQQDDIWYIVADDITEKYLGETIELETLNTQL